ncbi:hypothetical protein IT414_03390 [bacterium]|nr:hypothetical protein [bacterium]
MIKNYDLILRGVLLGLFSVAMAHTNQQLLDTFSGPVGVPLICIEYIAALWLVGWLVDKVEYKRKKTKR